MSPSDAVVLRAATPSDANEILALSAHAKPGLTSLPKDLERVNALITHSHTSFTSRVQTPGDEYYFFVLEHLASRAIIGTCSIYGRVGMQHPFYYYVHSKYERHSPLLNIRKRIELLTLDSCHYGLVKLVYFYILNGEKMDTGDC